MRKFFHIPGQVPMLLIISETCSENNRAMLWKKGEIKNFFFQPLLVDNL
jgi:hypothetical protein